MIHATRCSVRAAATPAGPGPKTAVLFDEVIWIRTLCRSQHSDSNTLFLGQINSIWLRRYDGRQVSSMSEEPQTVMPVCSHSQYFCGTLLKVWSHWSFSCSVSHLSGSSCCGHLGYYGGFLLFHISFRLSRQVGVMFCCLIDFLRRIFLFKSNLSTSPLPHQWSDCLYVMTFVSL